MNEASVSFVEVTEDTAGAVRFDAFLAALGKTKIQIGYQPPEGGVRYSSGISVAKLAAVHEFGGDELAARPFLRPTIERYQHAISELAEREIAIRIDRVVEGKVDPERAAEEIGKSIGSFTVKRIKERLTSASGWAQPLDPETVERKGSPTPLEETGLLIQSLSWRVTCAGNVTTGKD